MGSENLQNVTMRTEGSKLIIEVNLDMRLGPSKSGKTLLIATGGGPVPGTQAKMSLSVYTKDR